MIIWKQEIAKKLSHSLNLNLTDKDLDTPPNSEMGDVAFPCFKLAKQQQKAPPLIAKELAESGIKAEFEKDGIEIFATGPYLNFRFTNARFQNEVITPLAKSANSFGSLPVNSRGKHWVFEYSSPNVAKPFQIYHLRTTIVGASLSRIAKKRGYKVTRINHLGDWGTQYGKLAVALKRYASELPQELTLKDLVDVYVRIHKDMETHPELEKESQEAFRKLEDGDLEMKQIWQKCVDISLKEFHKTYADFQIEFDHYWGESFYEAELRPLLSELKNKGILIQDQGAWIVPATNRQGKEIPPCILEKTDGATIYATRDVAAALYRKKNLNFDRMTYVVGKEQMLHFEQVFSVLRTMKESWEPTLEHLPTGLYRLKDSKMSTRKGNFITLEEIFELCENKSFELMKARLSQQENETALSESDLKQTAKKIAIGAIVYADLSTDPTKDLEFDVNRVVSFEGETGPYLQYAYTRCKSILRKAEERGFKLNLDAEVLLEHPLEKKLIQKVSKWDEALERSLDQLKPSLLAIYVTELVQDFGTFYKECRVMDPEHTAMTQSRLKIVSMTESLLSNALDLLGIPKPDRM